MNCIDNILFFSTCIISRVEIQENTFLIYLKDDDIIIYLNKNEENFKKITVQFKRQYDKNLDNEVETVFEEVFSDKKDNNRKRLSIRYALIGLKHYFTLSHADFYNINETDLVSTEFVCKDRKLCKSLKKRYRELRKNV